MRYGAATLRFLASFGNVFLSLILGVIALGFCLLYLPEQVLWIQRLAERVHGWIMGFGWSPRVESILRFILETKQLVLMGFVLAFRLLLGIIMWLIHLVWLRVQTALVGADVAVAPAAAPTPRAPQASG